MGNRFVKCTSVQHILAKRRTALSLLLSSSMPNKPSSQSDKSAHNNVTVASIILFMFVRLGAADKYKLLM